MLRTQIILAPALAAVLSITFTIESHATSYASPSDFESVSPNGEFRFVADFPDTAALIENKNTTITYTLVEAKTGAVRWSLKGNYYTDTSEDWPSRAYGAFVGNQGGVLLYGPAQWVFTPLAAADGKVGPRTLYNFKAPYELEPIGMMSAVISRLMRYSFRSVIDADGRSYLLTRVCWGERRLIGFTEQALITELTEAQIAASDAAERQWVRDTLNQAPERLDAIAQELMPWLLQPRDERSGEARRAMWKYHSELGTAMQMASRFEHHDSIPEIRSIDRWRPAIPADLGLSEYDIGALQSSANALRQSARLALRRLGERPSNHQPATFAYPAWVLTGDRFSQTHSNTIALPDMIEYSDADVDSVSNGMPVQDVINLLGAPDSLLRDKRRIRVLEFDIDAEQPYTLVVRYKVSGSIHEPARVESVERITPPRWTIEARRDLKRLYRD